MAALLGPDRRLSPQRWGGIWGHGLWRGIGGGRSLHRSVDQREGHLFLSASTPGFNEKLVSLEKFTLMRIFRHIFGGDGIDTSNPSPHAIHLEWS